MTGSAAPVNRSSVRSPRCKANGGGEVNVAREPKGEMVPKGEGAAGEMGNRLR